MQPFYVVSPEYQTYHGSEFYDPPEWGADCIEVEAETKREAVASGVKRLLLERPRSWAADNRTDGRNPFAGYRAETARCGHGNPHFVLVGTKAVHLRCFACDDPPVGDE